MATLGEAFINVRADLKPFAKDLAKDLNAILAATEKEVERRGKDIGKKLSDSINNGVKGSASRISKTISKEVSKTKIEIKTEVDEEGTVRKARGLFSRVGILAKSAATSISKRFADAFVSTGRFIAGGLSQAVGSLGGIGGGGKGGGAGLALTAVAFGLLASAIAALIPVAVQATQAVGALVATLAVLPGAGVAIAITMGLLTLAFQGFDKAISAALEGDLEAFNKALEDLSPSAQRVARAMQPFLTMLQNLVQENFFQQIVGGAEKLFLVLRGSGVSDRLATISRQLGSIVDDFLRWLASSDGMNVVKTILGNISESLIILRPALRSLTQAFAVIIRAGSSVLPGIARVIQLMAEHFAAFIDKADRSGQLAIFFTQIQTVFEKLGPVLEQAVGLLLQFLNWALQNPDVITGMANAFFVFADALGEAFGDPAVVMLMQTILSLFTSISPEEWEAIITGLLRTALALGIIAAAILAAGATIVGWARNIERALTGIGDTTDKVKTRLTNAAAGFKAAGAALMKAFFDGIKSAIGGVGNVADAIVSRIKAGVNSAIGSINSRLDSAFSVFGVNIPNIPFLAKGAILDSPTLAMIAEKGPEAVIPLNDPARAAAIMMKSGLANMMAPIVNVFLGTEQLEARMYQVVSKNNASQAGSINRGPRTV